MPITDTLSDSAFCISTCPKDCAFGALNTVMLSLVGFAPYFNLPNNLLVGLGFVVLFSGALAFFSYHRGLTLNSQDLSAFRSILITLIIPLLLSAALINLKRGPWSGILIGALVLLFLYGRRYLIPLVVVLAISPLALSPIRLRIEQSTDHFFIRGGRAAIWEIGTELASKYPLGVGFQNSRFLRNFSPDIPAAMTHFHNNFINVVVETGWIGLALFVWWIGSILLAALREPYFSHEAILAATVGCAIISWQVAGLVEYNFGDAEVMLIVYILLGVLISKLEQKKTNALPASSKLYHPAL